MTRMLASLLLLCGLCNSLHAAEAAARPNILFIIFDDWGGARHSSIAGCPWIQTPNYDRVAREGVYFRNAFTSNPKCSPCRASILTGRNTWQLREAVSHNGLFPSGFETFPDLLEKGGYSIGLTGKGWGPGDFQTSGRTRNPAGPSFDQFTTDVPTNSISNKDYASNFAHFLKQRPTDKPFFFWIGFQEPHRKYEWNSGERLGKQLASVTVPAYLPDTEIVRRDLLDYAVEVEWGDAQIGKVLASLEAAGELDNTVVVVTSDHGMPFPYVKGQIHEDAFHLPLAIRWGKEVSPGRVVEDFINVRDFAPTFLELAGLPQHEQITGRSFVNILRSKDSGWIENRDVMLVGKERHDIGRVHDQGYPVRAIRTKDYLYVHNFHPERWPAGDPETDFGNVDPSPTKEVLKALGGYYFDLSFGKRLPDELYSLAEDPDCVQNLAHELAYQDVLKELRSQMIALLKEEGDPRILGTFQEFDAYRYTGGRNKGYESWLKQQEGTVLKDLQEELDHPQQRADRSEQRSRQKKAKATP
ncbi:sulfatase family protein [Planctomicrobium sp. SH664]|uniref:sulfatase family protein n=1 Tax=Planctomicrobium sp. SH664 TaxID=3448125 RepID=UPI003F5B164F